MEVGGLPVPRLILGHLPFVGESYRGPERNREYAERFSDVENTVRVLCRAVEGWGVTVASGMAAAGGLAGLFLEAVREAARRTGVEVALIPCLQVPLTVGEEPLDDYRRWLTYYEVERKTAGGGLLERYLEDPVLQCREGWRERFRLALARSKPYGKRDLKGLRLDYGRLRRAASSLTGQKVLLVEPGSEVDLLAVAGRLDLLSELVDWLRRGLGCPVLLGTHHAGSTIPVLEEAGIDFAGYVTPVNRLGVMMFPTRERALRAIGDAGRPVVAIKPLAGGRIPPRPALEWVYRDVGVEACMVGVGSEEEAEEDLSAALAVLSANR